MPNVCVKLSVTRLVSVRAATRESAYERAVELLNERIGEIQGADGEGATVSVQREGYPHWASV